MAIVGTLALFGSMRLSSLALEELVIQHRQCPSCQRVIPNDNFSPDFKPGEFMTARDRKTLALKAQLYYARGGNTRRTCPGCLYDGLSETFRWVPAKALAVA